MPKPEHQSHVALDYEQLRANLCSMSNNKVSDIARRDPKTLANWCIDAYATRCKVRSRTEVSNCAAA